MYKEKELFKEKNFFIAQTFWYVSENVFFCFQNVLLRKYGEGDYMAVVADFGLAAKIPHPV